MSFHSTLEIFYYINATFVFIDFSANLLTNLCVKHNVVFLVTIGVLFLTSLPGADGFAVFNCDRWNCPCSGAGPTGRSSSSSGGSADKRSLVGHGEHTRNMAENILSNIVST